MFSKTTDFGQTHTDISGSLPNIPVDDLVVDADLPNTLYAATDIGVLQTSDGGRTWNTLSSGLRRVVVNGLNLHRSSRTLRAATGGRSMWELAVPLAGASPGGSAHLLPCAGRARSRHRGRAPNHRSDPRHRPSGDSVAVSISLSGTTSTTVTVAIQSP